jgi:hypothetical protein
MLQTYMKTVSSFLLFIMLQFGFIANAHASDPLAGLFQQEAQFLDVE